MGIRGLNATPPMNPVVLTIALTYGFLLGLKLMWRHRGDVRQAGIVLAFFLVPAIAADHLFDSRFAESSIPAFGIDGGVGLAWAWQTFFAIYFGVLLLSALLSWLRRKHRGDELLRFHRVLLHVGLVLLALPIALKIRYPTLNFGNLLASLAVGSIVFGLAMQKLLANLFAGVGMELDNILRQGEFVQIGEGGPRGFVVEKTWRAVRIETLDGETIFIPNSEIFERLVWNFDRPTKVVGRRLLVSAAYDAPPVVVKETLLQVFAAEPSVLAKPPTVVRVKRFADSSIDYEARFWIHGMAEAETISDRVLTAIWYAFKARGIQIPFPVRTLLPVDPQEQKTAHASHEEAVGVRIAALARVEPFASEASRDELEYLARNGRCERFESGQPIVKKGDASDALHVIYEGSADVLLPGGVTRRLEAPGSFGEIGLLRATARTADVIGGPDGAGTIRLGRVAIEGLLGRSPKLRRALLKLGDDRFSELLLLEQPAVTAVVAQQVTVTRLIGEVGRLLRPW